MSRIEWIAVTNGSSDTKTGEAADYETSDEEKTGNSGSNINILYASLEVRVVLHGCCSNHYHARYVAVAQPEHQEDEQVQDIRADDGRR